MTTVILTSGTTWTVPVGVSLLTSVEAIGGGGGGAGGDNATAGGGGEYRKLTNLAVSAGTVIPIQIGSGGVGATTAAALGGDGSSTIFNTSSLIALGGTGGSATSGVGGTGGTGGTGFAGGNSGNYNFGDGGMGGGGAGGPGGTGKNGGDVNGAGAGGGGGGAASGGTAGSGNPSTTGGAGGNGTGTGGAGGTSNSIPGATGGAGAGGGGGFGDDVNNSSGGAGGAGTDWDASHGAGGGGGGAGGAGGGGGTGGGGAGGLYGGGGGAGGVTGGNGGQGIIVITYTATSVFNIDAKSAEYGFETLSAALVLPTTLASGATYLPRRAGRIKPDGHLSIDWTSPYAYNLRFFACEQFGRLVNLVRDNLASPAFLVPGSTAYPTRYNTDWGTALKFDGTSALFFVTPYEDRFVGSKTVGVDFQLTTDNGTINRVFGRTANNGLADPFLNWGFDYGFGFINAQCYSDSVNGLIENSFASTYATLGRRQEVLTMTGASTLKGWEKGRLIQQVAMPGNGDSFDTNANIIIGGDSDSAAHNTVPMIFNFAFASARFARWGDEMIRDFYSAPWQIVKRANRVLYFAPTAIQHTLDIKSGKFGFESGSPTLTPSATPSQSIYGFEAGSPTLVQQYTVVPVTAEFGFESTSAQIPTIAFNAVSAEFGFESSAVKLTLVDTPTTAEFGFEASTPLVVQNISINDVRSAEFGFEATSAQIPTIALNVVSSKYGFESTPAVLVLTDTPTSAKFGFESSTAKLTLVDTPNSAEFGFEAGSPFLSQRQPVSVNPAEFGFEATPSFFVSGHIFEVKSAEFGYKSSTPDAAPAPVIFFPSFKTGWEASSVRFDRYVSGLTPDARVYRVGLPSRNVYVSLTGNQ